MEAVPPLRTRAHRWRTRCWHGRSTRGIPRDEPTGGLGLNDTAAHQSDSEVDMLVNRIAAAQRLVRAAAEPLEGRRLLSAPFVVTTLASFNRTNGANPLGPVTLDGAGNLYGTTINGGENNLGTVFEIAKGSTTVTTLASFTGPGGAIPIGGVTLD